MNKNLYVITYLESIKLYTLEVPVNIENVLKLFGPIEEQGIKSQKEIMIKLFFTNHGPSRSEQKEIQDQVYVININFSLWNGFLFSYDYELYVCKYLCQNLCQWHITVCKNAWRYTWIDR